MNISSLFLPLLIPLFDFSADEINMGKETLVQIIIIQSIILLALVGYVFVRAIRGGFSGLVTRMIKRVKLEIILEKDRILRPQVLTMTISNIGKNEADIDAPVLVFRKIWTTRKFKLNGINGQHIYPMFIGPDKMHQLRIETATFHQYDRSIKSFYWAQIQLTDVDGRRWKSNKVKLRKSLVT